jgi:hypothetical protein
MKPIDFKGANVVFGKGQPEYRPLPVYSDGICVTSCWKPDFTERLQILLTGRIFVSQFTFGQALQPQLIQAYNPLEKRR